MPRVSILLTCYNHIKYLPQCIEGIRAQTFQDFEVIALDDGSQDGTREWLSGHLEVLFPQKSKLIFNEKNLGTYGTLNVGLSNSAGEYLAILNDDDLWEPKKLELQIQHLDQHPKTGLVHTDGTFIDGAGETMTGNPLGFEFPRTDNGDVLLALTAANKIIASAAVFRRSAIDQVGKFNEAFFGSGDWEMWYRIAEIFEVGYINQPLTHYRVHGENASHKLERIWKDDQMLREWMIPRFESYVGRFPEDELRLAQAHNFACLGTVQALNGEPKRARASYKKSLELNPHRWKSRVRFLATFLPRSIFRKLL